MVAQLPLHNARHRRSRGCTVLASYVVRELLDRDHRLGYGAYQLNTKPSLETRRWSESRGAFDHRSGPVRFIGRSATASTRTGIPRRHVAVFVFVKHVTSLQCKPTHVAYGYSFSARRSCAYVLGLDTTRDSRTGARMYPSMVMRGSNFTGAQCRPDLGCYHVCATRR